MSTQRGKIEEGGRLSIPTSLLKELGLEVGDDIILEADGGELRVRSFKDAVARAQALVRRYVPEGRSLADELIAERRDAAHAEEAQGTPVATEKRSRADALRIAEEIRRSMPPQRTDSTDLVREDRDRR